MSGARVLTSLEKRRVTAGGVYCQRCDVVHAMSRARGAVPGTCQECDVMTTDIHLVSVVAKVDGKSAINLVLVCTCCARRGLTIDLAELFGVDASRITEARGG